VDNRLAKSVIHRCLWQKDREDAMRVAAKIGIPLLTWDFSKEYKREVADYMIREYKAGRTPNPDVMCNHRIKFGVFLEHALRAGADYIATGHYVRLMRKPQNTKLKSQIKHKTQITSYKLLTAKDRNKDQSYFLWTLTQQQLKYCLFPIGDYTKPEVRRMAKKLGLPTADKKDSQGVCFVGPLNMKEFLKRYIKPKKGLVLRLNLNTVVGEHDGAYYYTIGQRHGLDIKDGKGPYYVAHKDIKKNIIYVSNNQQPTTNNQQPRIILKNVNWITKQPKLPAQIEVKIRYRSESIPVIISSDNLGHYILHTTYYILRAVTPGQSAVFYRGNELLGGGVIS